MDHSTLDNIPKPLPAEHVGISPRTEWRPESPAKSRPTSYISDQAPRLSSPSITQQNHPRVSRHRHTASTVPARATPELQEIDDGLPKESDFLTALASQERRVLELKDELKLAEEELTNLKKNWAHHEVTRRRTEGRRVHQMRPMSVSNVKVPPKSDDLDGSSAWMYEEMERRKALMGNAHTSSRRVFSGSRHTKQLSLVPPTREEQSSSSVVEALDTMIAEIPKTNRVSRSKTTPNIMSNGRDIRGVSPGRKEVSSPQHEVIQAGTKLANELKDGLWSFFEELKQVAVGDENKFQIPRRNDSLSPARNSVEASKSWTSLIRPQQDIKAHDNATVLDVASPFWKDNGLGSYKTNSTRRDHEAPPHQTPQKIPLHVREFEGETWETWDSPDAKHPSPSSEASTHRDSGSFVGSSPATSNEATPRAASSSSKHDSIPWPQLTKYGPAQLRRTASHLMSEWERSLTPPPSDGDKSRNSPVLSENREDLVEHEVMSQMR